jgi:hypothetical protein
MKIGIYKIGKPIYFNKNEEDHASWSIEVVNIIKIFKDRGHDIYILSETDYNGPDYHVGAVSGLDRIYVWNGSVLDDSWLSVQKLSKDIRLIVTDLALIQYAERVFNKIYTQSIRLHEYGAIELASLYEAEFPKYKKEIGLYFGGTERGRTYDFIEYIYRPNVTWYGKSDTLNIRNYIPYHEHLEMLKKAKYSVVIGDEAYNEIGFVTPRYYECLRYGVVPFVDVKFDPDRLIPIHEFFYVTDFIDMSKKIAYLEHCPEEFDNIMKEAVDLIPKEYIDGSELYNRLIN